MDLSTYLVTLSILSSMSHYGSVVESFSAGAPANSCKDPSTFHTKPINATHQGVIMPQSMATNPFRLMSDSQYFTPGQEISVSLSTADPNILLEGFFIQAIQANIDIRDLKRQAFGVFKSSTSRARSTPCQTSDSVERGGITHTDAKPKRNITVKWVAPIEYNPRNIQFLATGVQTYDIYWTDIRSNLLEPKGYAKTEGRSHQNDVLSTTAVWYRWLQYLRHHTSHGDHGHNHNHTSQSTS